MKKVIFIFLVFFSITPVVKAISASSYIVMDASSNRVLESSNMNEKKLIASTTKIMTAIVVLENTNINEKVVVDERVLKAYGSAIYIQVGEELTIKDLLYGLMLRSGNDAAIVLKAFFEDHQKDLVGMMNEKAKKINMNNTIFYNPHGLEEENGDANKSSAYDMALLMSYAIKNKEFISITNTKKYKLKTNKNYYEWYNKNKLLNMYKYCISGKTGYTKLAKRTLVTYANYNNSKLVIVTLNDPNDFNDHKKLYEKYFKNYNSFNILNKNNFKIRNEGYYRNKKIYIKNNYNIMLNEKEKNNISINYIIEKYKKTKNNQEIGKVQVLLNGDIIHEEKMYIKNSVKKKKNLFKLS